MAIAARLGVLGALLTALLVAPGPLSPAQGADCGGSHWVGAWSTAPGDAVTTGFVDQTLRMIVHPHLGGDRLRLRLTNRFGSQPVAFGDVFVGRRATGADIVAGTNQRVTFGGRSVVTLPARTDVVSDPVQLAFPAFSDLAVSLYARGATGPATEHALAIQTSYLTGAGSGSHSASEDGAAFSETTSSWFFLEGIDVAAPRGVGSVVTLGDSITDGFVSTGGVAVVEDTSVRGTNGRYPDNLARRLAGLPGPTRLAVLNAGIGGNRVVSDGFIPRMGPSAVSRLGEDVLAQPGVTDVIVMEGTNDLGMTPLPSADEVIAGLDYIVHRLQAAGLNVLLGTIPPADGALPGHGTPMANAERNRVNDWIRSGPHGVDVVDFHQALRDPANADRLRADYDSGDHLHPNLAGYRAMAETIDLDQLVGPVCPVTA